MIHGYASLRVVNVRGSNGHATGNTWKTPGRRTAALGKTDRTTDQRRTAFRTRCCCGGSTFAPAPLFDLFVAACLLPPVGWHTIAAMATPLQRQLCHYRVLLCPVCFFFFFFPPVTFLPPTYFWRSVITRVCPVSPPVLPLILLATGFGACIPRRLSSYFAYLRSRAVVCRTQRQCRNRKPYHV